MSASILQFGCGNMGASHAQAYQSIDGFSISGIVSTGKSKEVLNEKLGGGFPLYSDFTQALAETKPDAVCISTYPDTHEQFCVQALEAGCHVFIEKPIADTVAGAWHRLLVHALLLPAGAHGWAMPDAVCAAA